VINLLPLSDFIGGNDDTRFQAVFGGFLTPTAKASSSLLSFSLVGIAVSVADQKRMKTILLSTLEGSMKESGMV
jgi:hypothetical protein